jgi:hypothetical protein
MKQPRSFKTMSTTHPPTLNHIPDDLNPLTSFNWCNIYSGNQPTCTLKSQQLLRIILHLTYLHGLTPYCLSFSMILADIGNLPWNVRTCLCSQYFPSYVLLKPVFKYWPNTFCLKLLRHLSYWSNHQVLYEFHIQALYKHCSNHTSNKLGYLDLSQQKGTVWLGKVTHICIVKNETTSTAQLCTSVSTQESEKNHSWDQNTPGNRICYLTWWVVHRTYKFNTGSKRVVLAWLSHFWNFSIRLQSVNKMLCTQIQLEIEHGAPWIRVNQHICYMPNQTKEAVASKRLICFGLLLNRV